MRSARLGRGDYMAAIFAWWVGSAVVLVALGLSVGLLITGRLLGLLIDSRGRYSLTHLQLTLWTMVILSLVAGVFFGRWQHNVDPLGFTIPAVVLGLLGISVGSAVAVTTTKVSKNITHSANVAASGPEPWRPSLLQIFLLEEGAYADQVVDISKFQNFVITIVLVLAYVGLAVHTVTAAGTAAKVTTLPAFSGTFLVLLGISHAGYLAGKLPTSAGQPAGLTVASRDGLVQAAVSAGGQPLGTRPGQLWRQKLNVWTDSRPVAEIPAGTALVVAATRPFDLHWTTDDWRGPARDDTAVAIGGGRYAVTLPPTLFAGASEVQFTRRYLDGPVAGGTNDGWESPPGRNHVVRLEP